MPAGSWCIGHKVPLASILTGASELHVTLWYSILAETCLRKLRQFGVPCEGLGLKQVMRYYENVAKVKGLIEKKNGDVSSRVIMQHRPDFKKSECLKLL